MRGRQSHVDMHGIKRTDDTATIGTLEKAQLGQHLHIIMDAPDIAFHPACQFPHRHLSSTQRMHQGPTLGELAEETSAVSKLSTSPW
jgi:hypothetical protein